MREFNTSGPNITAQHYTLVRKPEMQKGIELVKKDRYFTIWAPRQTGKSTFFRQLAEELTDLGYKVAHINFENYIDAQRDSFVSALTSYLTRFWEIDFEGLDMADVFEKIVKIKDQKFVLIIDEVEGINETYFGSFLHAIRNAYHSRAEHALKSVILVGVSNIVGVVKEHASPFNVTENLNVPFFTNLESYELFKQHEDETGQLFEENVKAKICEITANQPGLVNGFAKELVERYPSAPVFTYEMYLEVEHWYLNVAIDKNVENIINKASEFRPFVETLLFTETKIPFKIDREAIKILHTNGVVREDIDKMVTFWVPLYKKRLYEAFYPYTNGEGKRISSSVVYDNYFTISGQLNIDRIIGDFDKYIQKRGFEPFREKDELTQKFKSIPEAAMVYAFETYIQAFLAAVEGKSYREAQAASGKTDLIITIQNEELLIETKIFYHLAQFRKGKEQLAYYAQHLGLTRAVYLVFIPQEIHKIHAKNLKVKREMIHEIEIFTYLIKYEDDLPEYRKPKKKLKVEN